MQEETKFLRLYSQSLRKYAQINRKKFRARDDVDIALFTEELEDLFVKLQFYQVELKRVRRELALLKDDSDPDRPINAEAAY